MPILEDYYRILQVHFLAEPEVIESAYKRLAKKYHPDVNKSAGSDARMKKINEAYETLSDASKRRVYDAQRDRRPEMPRPEPYAARTATTPKNDEEASCPAPARDALRSYFTCIKGKDFEGAYALITDIDKKNIPPDDFIKWQSGVARIYIMREYSFKAEKLGMNVRLGGRIFPQVAEFAVTTVEQNSVMGRLENDTIGKKVVLDEKGWRIYVGFDDIRPYIARFEELSGLLAAKSVISDMVEHYSSKDSGTGLYNKKGFSEAAQREIWRFNRYGNTFSLMLLEAGLGRDILRAKSQELLRHTAEWAGKLLNNSFRQLDILGRWGETGFIVLLPETNLNGCIKAAKKIKHIFEAETLVYGRKPYKVKVNIGLEEFRGSMEDTIRNLNNYIGIAGRSKGSSIVYNNGIYE
jgi:diguanylate cyclase (GGDEF)-like protein